MICLFPTPQRAGARCCAQSAALLGHGTRRTACFVHVFPGKAKHPFLSYPNDGIQTDKRGFPQLVRCAGAPNGLLLPAFLFRKTKHPISSAISHTMRDTGGQTDRFVRLFRCARERAGWVFFCLLFFSQKRKVDQWVRRLRPRERRRARTFLPLAVAILLRKPCTLLRWRFFG